jgi:glycosyltransferase involved in cell wall biosynthesis
MEKNYLQRALWQHKKLDFKLTEEKCDVLFVPGGAFTTKFRPVVTMSQNLIPFELNEMLRYGISLIAFKFLLLRFFLSFSFKKANGTIFLTKNAKDSVLKVTKSLKGASSVIPHGIDKKFFLPPRPQRKINKFSCEYPFQLLYVSTIEPYKHHHRVIDATVKVRDNGFPLVLKLIGSGNSVELNRLKKKINNIDPEGNIINYIGFVSNEELPSEYFSANIFLFASSCENMPITLMEGMASGVPIVCSDRGPMPEVLGDAGVYFNPENTGSIARAIRTLTESPELRVKKAKMAFKQAQKYSWSRCAKETFSFLSHILDDYKKNNLA